MRERLKENRIRRLGFDSGLSHLPSVFPGVNILKLLRSQSPSALKRSDRPCTGRKGLRVRMFVKELWIIIYLGHLGRGKR